MTDTEEALLQAILDHPHHAQQIAAWAQANPDALAQLAGEHTEALLEHGFTGTDRLGRKWVDGKEVASVKADTPADKPPAFDPAEHEELASAVGESAKDPSRWGRIKERYGKVRDVVMGTVTHLAAKLGPYAPDVLLEARDFERITTQPGSDPISREIGFSANDAIKIASIVLGKAHAWITGRGEKKEAIETPDFDALADAVIELRQQVNEALGIDLPLPEHEQVVASLKERIGAAS